MFYRIAALPVDAAYVTTANPQCSLTFPRKMFNRLFTVATFKTFMRQTFDHHGRELISQLHQLSQSGETVNIQDLFFKFTLDSIGTSWCCVFATLCQYVTCDVMRGDMNGMQIYGCVL